MFDIMVSEPSYEPEQNLDDSHSHSQELLPDLGEADSYARTSFDSDDELWDWNRDDDSDDDWDDDSDD